jgi:hypothetical protein
MSKEQQPQWDMTRELQAEDIASRDTGDNVTPVEPCRIVPECTTPVRPGSHNAAAAYRSGTEDDYSNRMAARCGGEW